MTNRRSWHKVGTTFIAALILVGALLASTISIVDVKADSGNQGSKATAYQKLYNSALHGCVSIDTAWKYNYVLNPFQVALHTDDLRSGKWFKEKAVFDDWSVDGAATTWGGGAIIEREVTGSYSDGKIYCGENNNALVSQSLSQLNVGLYDVLCDAYDGYSSSGVIYVDTGVNTCKHLIDTPNKDAYLNTNRTNYLNGLIADKTFHDNIPGGSLYALTNLEKYYIYYDTFKIACTGNSDPIFGNTDLKYQAIVWNPSTQKFESAGFPLENSGGYSVYTFNGESKTCSELVNEINKFGEPFKAYHDSIMNAPDGPIAKCKEAYSSEYEKIRNYYQSYSQPIGPASSFVSQIDAFLNRVRNKETISKSDISVILGSVGALKSAATSGSNGVSVFDSNAFDQDYNALGVVTSKIEAGEPVSDELLKDAQEWNNKVSNLVTTAKNNQNTIKNFLDSNNPSSVDAWEYDSNGLNGFCRTTDLANSWDETSSSLEDPPKLDGTFNPGDYIDNSSSPDSPGVANYDQPACYTAAKTLGWVLCPVLEGIGNATKEIYKSFIEPFLNTSATFFNSDSSARDGWNTFRNFANILFAIAFIIVILAQVTGIGISNYNIKKILPRLIMVVVLVNLSFIICQLLVDVSNIVGSGLYDLFMGLAGGVEMAQDYGVGGIIQSIVGTGLGLIVGGGAIAIAVATWDAWLIPLLLAVVGCVVGVIFFFIILGVRQAGVIILVVLAPAAIVCYALPNTQNIYKRWWKMFSSLLLVYPICGALLGGGTYASYLILGSQTISEQNFFLALVAMLLQVIPFFMIPSIVKGSMSAIGNIGAKISSAGSRVGKWGQARVAGSDRMRAFQGQLQDRRNDRFQRRSEAASARSLQRMQRSRERAIENGRGDAWDRRHGDRLGRAILRQDAIDQNRAKLDVAREHGPAFSDAARMNSMTTSMRNSVIDTDAKAYELDYENRANFDTSSTKDNSDLMNEHARLLEQVTNNPADLQSQARLRAIQSIMMKQKDKGFEAMNKNYQALQGRYDALRTVAAAPNASQADRDRFATFAEGVRRASGHLAQNYAGDLKTYGGKGAMIQYQNMQNLSGDAQRGSAFDFAIDSNNDASSLNESSLNDLSDEWFDRTFNSINNGSMSTESTQQLLKTLNRYKTNPNIAHKGSVEKQIDRLTSAIYGSRQNMAAGAGTRNIPTTINAGAGETAGSRVMRQADSSFFSNLASRIESAGAYDTSATGETMEAQNSLAREIANVQQAYNNSDGKLSQDQAEEMEHVLQLAQANYYARANNVQNSGVQFATNASGHIEINDLNGMTFDVPRAQTVDLYNERGWLNIDGDWYDGNAQRLSADDAALAEKITQRNAEIRLENEQRQQRRRRRNNPQPPNPPTPPNPNPNPPTPPPSP